MSYSHVSHSTLNIFNILNAIVFKHKTPPLCNKLKLFFDVVVLLLSCSFTGKLIMALLPSNNIK